MDGVPLADGVPLVTVTPAGGDRLRLALATKMAGSVGKCSLALLSTRLAFS